jgi:hypothetical protein
MMRVLFFKELRALRPLAWCIVGMHLLGTIFLLATEMPDEQKFVFADWMAEDRHGWLMVLALFALMIGAGLLLHESEQGTLRFLDGLPVSRTRLFLAKVLAGLAVLALVPLLGVPEEIIFDQLSRTSIDEPYPWGFPGALAGLAMVAGAFLLALALALSFVRRWFALAAGLLFWGYLWLRQHGGSRVGLFDPGELLAVGLVDGRVLVPWGHVAAHLVATAVLLAVAWFGFLQLGDRAQFAGERLGRSRVLRGLGVGLRWLAPVVWLGAMVHIFSGLASDAVDFATTPGGERAFGRRETARYEFLYRSAQEKQAEPLMEIADETHDQVAGFFEAAPPPARIVVDLASPVVPHAAGQTNWTKIRMPLAAEQTLDEQRLILGHETAHVFIEQLSGGRLASVYSAIRFLHEGLATHVEQQLFAEEEDRAQNRRSVAAAWARGRVPFELLCDNERLSRERDPNLAYPLGEVFARALVETHGRAAAAELLHAFARPKAAVGKDGMALWRDTMQAARLDFDRVVAAYESACARLAEEERDFVARCPRLAASVAVEGAEIVVRPKFDGAAPGELVCLVEIDGPLMDELSALSQREDGSFTIERRRVTKSTLRYLLGWRTKETRLPIFEPWSEGVVGK